jgi:cytochrome c oxidase cbb3-type subunit 3
MSRVRRLLIAWAAVACALLVSCEREIRSFRPEPPTVRTGEQWIRLSNLQPGAGQPVGVVVGPAVAAGQVKNEYEENAFALSEGKRLFSSFNCTGCHANGGGGMGPPLLDDKWIYGHEPQQVFATIVEGRPNGMPTFGGRIPAYQIWQLAAYVRSISGLVPKDAAPGRDDDMQGKPPENTKDPETPVEAPLPPSAKAPQ